jgi:hypothetical protein
MTRKKFKDNKDDPLVQKCPKIVDLDYCQSFFIVVKEINWYSYESKENWMKTFRELNDKHYK